jgi:DNA-binding NtrC family response regulator
MEDRITSRPWHPKPFSIAILDSDETMADALRELLHERGFDAAAFYDISSLARAHQSKAFDAYVLDFLADWLPQSNALEDLVDSIRGSSVDVPIFILGNQVAPERTEKLGNILMRHKVRYVLKPVRAVSLAQSIGEAIAARAGL